METTKNLQSLMIKRKNFLTVLPLLLSLMPMVSSFSNGEVFAACNTMVPLHPFTLGPHWSKAPYTLSASQNPDGTVDVNIEVIKGSFRGFLLQARNSTNMIVGQFTAVPPSAQLLSCGYEGAAVSHSSNDDKTRLTTLWTPRGHFGEVTFRATMVRNYFSYWTQVMSPTYII